MFLNGKHIEKIYTGANFNHITKYIDNINSRFNVNFYYRSNKTYPRLVVISKKILKNGNKIINLNYES